MKKLTRRSLFVFLVLLGTVYAQSSSEIDKNGSNSQQTNITIQTSSYNDGSTTISQNTKESIKDTRVPSSYQFLIEFCESKEDKYYMPRKKFLELTEQQQTYLLNNETLFIIKD